MGHDLNLCIRNLVLKQTYSLISTYLFNKLLGGGIQADNAIIIFLSVWKILLEPIQIIHCLLLGIIVSRVFFQLDDVKITLRIFTQKV